MVPKLVVLEQISYLGKRRVESLFSIIHLRHRRIPWSHPLFVLTLLLVTTAATILTTSCGKEMDIGTVPDDPVPTSNTSVDLIPTNTYPTIIVDTNPPTHQDPTPSSINSNFTINSILCADKIGPDCANLRLGDNYITTSTPAQGYLYSCAGKNPHAPGSRKAKITWIDFINETWTFLEKLWLPRGSFATEQGSYTETLSSNKREISINNLPVDGKIGDWPMTSYPILTDIDPNPGIPKPNGFSFSYPINPERLNEPSCVSQGPIGITTNGVVIYNAADARGDDAVAHEIIDEFGGHPAMSDYHYHFIPDRLDTKVLTNGHSGVVGYINDGFPIHGYRGIGGVEMTNDDLDLCHGHQDADLSYHYHATLEYPYTIGCYKGAPISIDNKLNRPARP